MKSLIGPGEFNGGRGQAHGGSPGCLVLSILASIVLTILILNWF